LHLQLQKLLFFEKIEKLFSVLGTSVDLHSNRDAIIACEASAALADRRFALLTNGCGV
jgi:hypothetical protein